METDKNKNQNNPSATDENYYRIVKPLKTYERDTAEFLRERGASQVDIRLQEEQRRREEIKKQESKFEKPAKAESLVFKKLALATVILLLSFLSIFIVSGIFRRDIDEELAKRPSLKAEVLIKGDDIQNIDTTGKNRKEILEIVESQLQNISVVKSRIVVIYPIEKETDIERALSAEEFLIKITSSAPGYLLRAVGPKMTFGYYTKEKFIPFLLLEVNSPGNAYAGMLDWEKNMASDLSGFIVKTISDRRLFDDFILMGKDLRILRDFDGTVVLAYSFIDDKTLLITGEIETFKEILDKYLLTK